MQAGRDLVPGLLAPVAVGEEIFGGQFAEATAGVKDDFDEAVLRDALLVGAVSGGEPGLRDPLEQFWVEDQPGVAEQRCRRVAVQELVAGQDDPLQQQAGQPVGDHLASRRGDRLVSGAEHVDPVRTGVRP